MNNVTVVEHPLVQHKLTLMRDKTTSTKGFRQLLREISTLLCYEVTRDLPLDPIDIETPLMPMRAHVLSGKKLVFAPILRAGMGLLEGGTWAAGRLIAREKRADAGPPFKISSDGAVF